HLAEVDVRIADRGADRERFFPYLGDSHGRVSRVQNGAAATGRMRHSKWKGALQLRLRHSRARRRLCATSMPSASPCQMSTTAGWTELSSSKSVQPDWATVIMPASEPTVIRSPCAWPRAAANAAKAWAESSAGRSSPC